MSKSCEAAVAPPAVEVVGFLIAHDGGGRLRFFGELDASEVPRVRACLAGVDGDIEFDCSGLSFIDAAGLGLLVELDTECRARGAKLLVINPEIDPHANVRNSAPHHFARYAAQAPISNSAPPR